MYNDGVVVTTIASPTSPGRMAGLKVDDVIVKVNGEVWKYVPIFENLLS